MSCGTVSRIEWREHWGVILPRAWGWGEASGKWREMQLEGLKGHPAHVEQIGADM